MSMFTVIIPFWNAGATLAQTLTSVARQRFGDFDVIMIDDGSTDTSLDIARAFAAYYPHFRLVSTDNGGPSAARNMAALTLAKGDVLAFLDADDVWSPDRLEHLAQLFERNPQCDAAYSQVGFFRDDCAIAQSRAVSSRSSVLRAPVTIRDLLRGNPACTMSNIAVRTSAFRRTGGFDPDMRYAEDIEWMMRLVGQGGQMLGLDEMLVYYRTSDAGLSANLLAMQHGWKQALATARLVDPQLDDRDIAAAEASHLRYLARRALRLDMPRGTALAMAARGLRTSPRGFFSDPLRGALTLAAAAGETLMPATMRSAVFDT